MSSDDFYVLSVPIIDALGWETRMTVAGTRERLSGMFDLSKLPHGALLLKGKLARRFLKRSLRDELRYRAEQRLRK